MDEDGILEQKPTNAEIFSDSEFRLTMLNPNVAIESS